MEDVLDRIVLGYFNLNQAEDLILIQLVVPQRTVSDTVTLNK